MPLTVAQMLDAWIPPTGALDPGDALHHAMTRTLSQNAACLPYLLNRRLIIAHFFRRFSVLSNALIGLWTNFL